MRFKSFQNESYILHRVFLRVVTREVAPTGAILRFCPQFCSVAVLLESIEIRTTPK